MKRKLSILAAAGGVMLISLAAAGLFWPDTKQPLQAQPTDHSTPTGLQLKPVHPDEPVSYTFEERFSLKTSLEVLPQIRGALESFRSLTEKSKKALGEKATTEVGNTDWEIQHLGFPNWVGTLEGTLKKQDYQIKKLEFELAQKQYEDGEITQEALDQKATRYRQAEQEFQSFWNSFKIAD